MSALSLVELDGDLHAADMAEEQLRRMLQRHLHQPLMAMFRRDGHWYAMPVPGEGGWRRVTDLLNEARAQ